MIQKLRIYLTSVFGLLLATFGLLFLLNSERLQRNALEHFMVLRPNTFISQLWENPTMDLKVNIYLFNWTNSEAMKYPNTKPHVQEIGPYVFKEKHRKLNVVWHDENSTVSYLRRSYFYFDEAASVGRRLDDIVVAPNSLAVALHTIIKYWSPMVRSLIDLTLHMYGNGLTSARSADDWMFGGFVTPLVKVSKIVPKHMMSKLQYPYERIGYGYPRNGSTEIYGHHNVYTGEKDFSKVGQIARWRFDNHSAAYPNCGPIKGSAGEYHPIPLKKGRPISFFLPDLCRELQLDYFDVTQFENIEAYVYKASPRTFGNSTINPGNSCYCSVNCEEVPSGIMNISSCWYNVPVFASLPHYYLSDSYYADQVDGLKPDKERHEMVVILEPKTGLVLEIKARLMLTLLMEPSLHSVMYRNVKRTFLPLVWVDYEIHITPELLFYLKLMPLCALIAKISAFVCVSLGLFLVLWYPRQKYCKKHLMHKIEITNLETRFQAQAAALPEQIKAHAEASPLLVELQYVGGGPAAGAASEKEAAAC